MQELMRESRGDFKSYLRVETEMFCETLDCVAQRRGGHDLVRRPCTGAARSPYGRRATCSRAPYDSRAP